MKNIDFLMTTPLWKGLKEEEIEAILPCLRSEEKFIKKGDAAEKSATSPIILLVYKIFKKIVEINC